MYALDIGRVSSLAIKPHPSESSQTNKTTKKSDRRRLLGAHVSAGRDNNFGITSAQDLKINTAQIFGSNKVQWAPRSYSKEQISRFRCGREKAGLEKVFSHGIYLINLGADKENPVVYEKSIRAVAEGLKICDILDLDGLIIHLGSNYGLGIEGVLGSVITGLLEARKLSRCNIPLLLENAAGSPRVIGGRLEDFAPIIEGLDGDPRIQVCLDTAHAYAFGYDLRTDEGLSLFLSEAQESFELERLTALHINDSKVACGETLDRHENLGAGKIGFAGLSKTLNHPLLINVPAIMETPGFDGTGPDRGNVEILKSLCGELAVAPEILMRRARQRASRRHRNRLASKRIKDDSS